MGFRVATWNVHAGVDAWGRPTPAVEQALGLGADLLALQENWSPDDGPSLAAEVAEATGAWLLEVPLGTGRRGVPHPDAGLSWHRREAFRDGDQALYIDSERPLRDPLVGSERVADGEPGSWGIALLTTLPVLRHEVLVLPQLAKDRARRRLITVLVETPEGPVRASCLHMSHLIHGSPRQYRQLAAAMGSGAPLGASVLLGDMNCWGPPLTALLPGWRRAVTGRTWPAWRPHSQLDHVLVGRGLEVLGGRVDDADASDHLPVVAELRRRAG